MKHLSFAILAVLLLLLAGCVCADDVKGRDPRIVGGTTATVQAYPFMAAFVGRGSSQSGCGASILSSRWLLTAAHCWRWNSEGTIRTNDPSSTQYLVGRTDLFSEGGQRLDIRAVILHPDWPSNALFTRTSVDVALVYLDSDIQFTSTVQPITLAEPADAQFFAPGLDATVVGWGATTVQGEDPSSDQLRQVTIPLVDPEECGNNLDHYFCAGTPGKDSCVGDSGGPIVVRNAQNQWIQPGLVSFGLISNENPDDICTGTWGFYCRVSDISSWISSTMAAGDPTNPDSSSSSTTDGSSSSSSSTTDGSSSSTTGGSSSSTTGGSSSSSTSGSSSSTTGGSSSSSTSGTSSSSTGSSSSSTGGGSDNGGGGSSLSCFPGDATVVRDDGATLLMSELRVGDHIQAVDEAGQLVYSQVYTFLDRSQDQATEYLRLETEQGAVLRISARHRVFVMPPTAEQAALFSAELDVDADQVHVGQALWLAKEQRWHTVRSIEVEQQRGAYAPATVEGTLVVDGVLASCYAMASHHAAHAAFAPLRLAAQILPAPLSIPLEEQVGVNWYAQLLLSTFGSLY